MGRSSRCEKVGLKKGQWTPEEDQKLRAYIEEFGHGSWRALPAKAGLQRCGKSCRLRWTNYLRPDIKRGEFSLQEEQTIIQLHALLGNRWSAIAAQLPMRTDNEIKNYWNTRIKKRLTRLGIDPTTHKPRTESMDASNLRHMAQWESARLEAEARLVKLRLGSCSNPQPMRLVLKKITTQQPSLPPCLDILKAWQSHWSSEAPTTTKDYKMHCMYAMMLSTDDNTLESPTSTSSFQGDVLPLPLTTTTNTVGLFGEDLLPLTTTNVTSIDQFIKSSTTNDNEAWRCLTQEGESRVNLQDDDIMAAVEAFRSSRYDNISILEPLDNDDTFVYDSSNDNLGEEDLAMINGDENIYHVNFQENSTGML